MPFSGFLYNFQEISQVNTETPFAQKPKGIRWVKNRKILKKGTIPSLFYEVQKGKILKVVGTALYRPYLYLSTKFLKKMVCKGAKIGAPRIDPRHRDKNDCRIGRTRGRESQYGCSVQRRRGRYRKDRIRIRNHPFYIKKILRDPGRWSIERGMKRTVFGRRGTTSSYPEKEERKEKGSTKSLFHSSKKRSTERENTIIRKDLCIFQNPGKRLSTLYFAPSYRNFHP
jgi:hypothetical protein